MGLFLRSGCRRQFLRKASLCRKGGEGIEEKDPFFGYHPGVNLLYFALVLLGTMVFWHPLSLLISFGSALGYLFCLRGRKGGRALFWALPMALLAAVVNPACNHRGNTILTYLPTGNPLTLESILYGGAAAVLLVSVLLWFSCYQAVMTADKFLYLCGRVFPALSLVLSMTLRFVPRFRQQLQAVCQAQRCLGRDASCGSLLQRLCHGVTILSILVTWSLENAVETADSMKSRGYGLPHRTAFSIYTLDRRDRLVLGWLAFCGLTLFIGWGRGGLAFQYYPALRGTPATAFSLGLQGVYAALCLTPVFLHGKEAQTWKRLH